MTAWLLLILLAVICLAGVILSALQLPGTWLALAATAGYDWYYDWQRIGWKWLAALVAVALAAEAMEMFASVAAARRAGASRRAAVGALVGGLAGMLLLSIPIPVLGTIIGGLVGCFAGAFVAELTVHDDLSRGARVGFFAALGRLCGLVGKVAASLGIAGAAVSLATLATLGR
jgi:uncharacterized protein YqgC (DUF456 family)